MFDNPAEGAPPRRVIFPSLHSRQQSLHTNPPCDHRNPSDSLKDVNALPDLSPPESTARVMSSGTLASEVKPHDDHKTIAKKYVPVSVLRSSKSNQAKHILWPSPKEDNSGNSLPGLVSFREDEGTESENSEDSSTATESAASVKFDPRVWICEFERSADEHEKTFFSSKEMERFKKQALIRIYVHAVRQEEFIATGTGRVVRRKVQIPKRALFSNPALAMDGEPDEDGEKASFPPLLKRGSL